MNIQEELQQLNISMSQELEHMQESQLMKRQIETSLNALKITEGQIQDLLIQLEKEEQDVEKLKTMSFANFFHTLINDKPEQLNKEELEVMAVKAKIDRLISEKEAESSRVDNLRLKHTNPSTFEDKYNALLEKKTKLIINHLPDLKQELDSMQDKIDESKMADKEIREALAAGKIARDQVGRIQKSLQSAANWGTYDMMGGGMLATMAKRSHLDTAQREMHEFQNGLRNFNRELKDVGEAIEFDIQITEFLGFADWFFDGFFVDWAVQSKINDAKGQMSQLDGKIRLILDKLNDEDRACRNRIDNLEREILSKIKGA